MKVAEWGNSLAVRLPKDLVDALDLKAGDTLDVVAATPGVLTVERNSEREAALARMAARNLELSPDYKFNREEANER